METYDVIVVGGGPSGLMAALAAQSSGARTALVEKGNKLGRKLGISGGGRCNVTNAKPLDLLMQNIPGNARFLYSALTRFSNQDIMAFFENLGIRLKEEDRGRVFPISDKASTVVQALVDAVYDAGVEVWTDTSVKGLRTLDDTVRGVDLQNGSSLQSRAVIVSTGGCSVPKTGSTGDAYPWAKRIGHTIVDPFPTEVPLTSDDSRITSRQLQGISLRNIQISIYQNGKKRLTTEDGDMIFTHLGLSGPAALRCSHYVSTSRRKKPDAVLTASIDLLPEIGMEDLFEEFRLMKADSPKRHLLTALSSKVQERLAKSVLEAEGMEPSVPLSDVKNQQLRQLAQSLKAFNFLITGTLPLAQATVTGGGVSVKQIDPTTMGSKLCSGLFFSGEVMDVHAHTGGYNITVAFSTGRLAGQSAAEYAKMAAITSPKSP